MIKAHVNPVGSVQEVQGFLEFLSGSPSPSPAPLPDPKAESCGCFDVLNMHLLCILCAVGIHFVCFVPFARWGECIKRDM